jgi:hypothetical protein
VLALIFSVISMLPASKAFCQSAPKPAVVVSIAKFSEQLKDIEYILTASGFAQMKFMAKAMISGYTKGLDPNKDAGVLLYFEEDSETPDFLGFVPVEDIDEMLDVVATVMEVEENDDFITAVADDGTEILIKEQNGYAYMSNKKGRLGSLPDNPEQLVGDIAGKYNLSAQVFGQRIPEKLRTQLLDTIKDSSEQALDAMDEGIQTELQKKNLEMQMRQMKMMLTESDRLLIGMKADAESKRMTTDVEFTALPGSKLAKMMTESKASAPSRFTGFLMDGATFTTNSCARLGKEEAEQYSSMLEDLQKAAIEEMDADGDMSEQDLAVVEKAMGEIADVLKATMKEGLLDTGAVLMLKDGEINFAGGAQIADPKKLESTIKDLVAMAEEKMDGEIEVNLNSGNHKNVTFHEIQIPVPDDEEEVRDAIGDQIEVIVGIGTKEVYIGIGSNPMATLKAGMDGTQMAKEIMQYNLYLQPIMEFAANMEGDETVEAMAEALKEAGNDRISMTSDLIENGMKMQFELQDGILGLIKVGFDAAQGGGGGFDDDFTP